MTRDIRSCDLHGVGARTTDENVAVTMVIICIEDIITRPPIEDINPSTAIKRVIAIVAMKCIAAGPPFNDIRVCPA